MNIKDIEDGMKRYRDFRPTVFDTKGLGLPDRQDWIVCLLQTRDSDALTRSNYRVLWASLQEIDPDGNDHEEHTFGHWGPGWFDLILVRPGTACAKEAAECLSALSDYPILSEEDFSALELEDADATWRNCYTDPQRIEWLRDHWRECEFHGFADLLGAVRGRYFPGDAGSFLRGSP